MIIRSCRFRHVDFQGYADDDEEADGFVVPDDVISFDSQDSKGRDEKYQAREMRKLRRQGLPVKVRPQHHFTCPFSVAHCDLQHSSCPVLSGTQRFGFVPVVLFRHMV